MFSIAKRSSSRVTKPLTRRLATEAGAVVAITQKQQQLAKLASTSTWKTDKVPVREDHGLWGFFRRKTDASLTGEDAYETVESPSKLATGRAWRASELRLKSFQDLHTLWYVTLRERNLLATQKEEARRMGVKINLQAQTIMAGACRKTMGRIKAIMNERRIAYQGALKLIEEHAENIQDKRLLQMQREALVKAKKQLALFATRGRILRREKLRKIAEGKKALQREGLLATGEAQSEATTTEVAPSSTPEPTTPSPAAKEQVEAAAPTPEASFIPQTPAETATAGLFGANRK